MIDEWERTPWASTLVLAKPDAPTEGPAKAITGNFAAHVEYGQYLMPSARTPQAMMARAQAAYHSNPWVGTAEATVTRRVVGLPWHLEDMNDEEYEEPYSPDVKAAFDLLEKPQSQLPPQDRDPGILTRRSLVSITSRHLGLCGMAYWYLDQMDIFGRPLALLYVNPARVWAATTKAGRITGWVLDPSDGYGNGGTPLSLSELLPFYLDPPDRGAYGTGLYERATLKAQITTLADQHAAYLLGTGGRLAGIVSPKEGTILDEQYKALVNEFRTVNEAPDAAKRTTVLRGPIDFTATGADPEKLSLIELSTMNRNDIFTIWGVPPRMAGVEGQSAGLNSGETLKYEEAILMQGPVHDRVLAIRETIQFGLLDRWLPTVIDLEIEEPTFDDRSPLFDLAKAGIDQPLTVAERRELLGMAPFGKEITGSSGGPLDAEVWLPALQTLAYSSAIVLPPPTAPLVPFTPAKAAPRKEFLGLRQTLDTSWVPKVRRTVSEVLRAQRTEVAAKLRSTTEAVWQRQRANRQHWFDAAKEADRMRKVLSPIIAGLATTVGDRTASLLKQPAKADSYTDTVVSQLITTVGSRITGITETTQDAVASTIEQGYLDGLSPLQIADLIEGLPAFDDVRAEMVARTETMFAYNSAALSSYGEFGVTEVEASDGDKDDACASRDGRTFSVEEANDIEDHPNGTLAWIPIVPVLPEEAKAVNISPIVAALMETVVSNEDRAKAALIEQQSQTDGLLARLATAMEAMNAKPAPEAPQITVVSAQQPAPVVNVTTPEVTVNVPEQAAPQITVVPSEVKILTAPEPDKRVIYDKQGRVSRVEVIE